MTDGGDRWEPGPYSGQYGAPSPGRSRPSPPAGGGGTNTLAIVALVAAFLVGLLGVVLGLVAKSQIRRTGEGGDGLATAAIAVGALNMLLGAVVLLGGGLVTL